VPRNEEESIAYVLKRPRRCIKKKKELVKMVVEEDVYLEWIPEYHGLALIGIFHDREIEERRVQWSSVLDHSPKFNITLRG
jgi:alpha-D-ribose 1-methylphosphonate 5-triphosphate synthase subunit PhnL